MPIFPSGRHAGGAAGRLDRVDDCLRGILQDHRTCPSKAFVFENVRGILGTNRGEDWKAILKAFGRLGYAISYRLLDALDYGAPQQRERMFLVGHQLGEPFLFRSQPGPDSTSGAPHLTAGKAFHGIQETEDLEALALEGGKYSHLLPLVPPGENYLHFTAKRGLRPILLIARGFQFSIQG
ncbi:DNA cytosine methyltransferase [Sphingomonas sp.]|uniref:DNA cytosine methyltransferase n=1 Tax=Sphingomonas sp. TaxID=28214 RepID=UPI001ECA7EF6|nr:DNA cytosine methyltransferase [Sphingomonas sp.]MBX3593662.1 DNA cytosine methyltransferase [Sphingomonas sp.]